MSIPRWIAVLLLAVSGSIADAHKPSDSYLQIDLDGDVVTGQWDIAVRDLDYAIGLDADGDGAITWGELRRRQQQIATYALARLQLNQADTPCHLHPTQQLVDEHSDGAYNVLRFSSNCSPGQNLSVSYGLLFDLDPSHRGLLKVQGVGGERTAVLSPDNATFVLAGAATESGFGSFWREGVWHIWKGTDHILFLLILLLPAVLSGGDKRAPSSGPLRGALLDVVGVVSAFTLAHSLTLGLAVMGWVELPSRWVESAIAASLILAAANNLLLPASGYRWRLAFVLGLVHGFGFASVLADLSLSGSSLMLALAAFNIGVECGQLAIVFVFLPLAYGLRNTLFYRLGVLRLGSLAVLGIAVVWLVERSLSIDLVAAGLRG